MDEWEEKRPGKITMRETIRAENAFAKAVFAAAGITKIRSVHLGKSCPYCRALDGTVIDIKGNFLTKGEFQPDDADEPLIVTGNRGHPPYHNGCLSGHSRVLAESVSSASKRWYDGDIIILKTARGYELQITPNHPILTPQGWIAAGLLDEGDDVISNGFVDRIKFGDGNTQYDPPPIEDVAEALFNNRQMAAVPVPTATKDFHGDGVGSEVAIIGTDRELWNRIYAPVTQQGGKLSFVRGNSDPAHLSGLRGKTLLGEGLLPSNGRAVGSSRLCFSLGRSHLSSSHQSGFATRAEYDSMLSEPSSDYAAGDSEYQRQAIDRLAGQISPDKIVSVKRDSFHGFVYNLQTDSGFYIAEGIIAHNCDCTIAANI
jgi:hypothetical protein